MNGESIIFALLFQLTHVTFNSFIFGYPSEFYKWSISNHIQDVWIYFLIPVTVKMWDRISEEIII